MFEGRVVITEQPLRVQSQRPTGIAQKLLVGKKPEQVITLLPALYSLCAQGHRFAAHQVLSMESMGLKSSPEMKQLLMMQTAMEIIREHWIALVSQWPKIFLNQEPDITLLEGAGNWVKQIASLVEKTEDIQKENQIQLFAKQIENRIKNIIGDLDQWIQPKSSKQWEQLIQNTDYPVAKPILKIMDWEKESSKIRVEKNSWPGNREVAKQILSDLSGLSDMNNGIASQWVNTPQWKNAPCENSCYTKMISELSDDSENSGFIEFSRKFPLAARMVARMIDLAKNWIGFATHLVNYCMALLKILKITARFHGQKRHGVYCSIMRNWIKLERSQIMPLSPQPNGIVFKMELRSVF